MGVLNSGPSSDTINWGPTVTEDSVCERFLGSVRRECLDHIIILGEQHLRSVIGEYLSFFNACWPHQGREQRPPVALAADAAAKNGKIVAVPVLGGLHHDYRRAA